MGDCARCDGSGFVEVTSREWGHDVEPCPDCSEKDDEYDADDGWYDKQEFDNDDA